MGKQMPSMASADRATDYYELEVIPGLAPFAQTELQEKTRGRVQVLPGARGDQSCCCNCNGRWRCTGCIILTSSDRRHC
jgi:hypothetical protein